MNNEIKKVISLFMDSGKKKIAIIGKGPSLDEIERESLDDFFIININDSELIKPGDVCLYVHEWVKKYFEKNERLCKLYLTAEPVKNDQRFLQVGYIPENPENYRPIQERFLKKNLSSKTL
ncbi:hypothetical protein [Citrobacter freundii complex sp. CFNIH2]|uniref:hypothetical protein n=1 Tax=Citrobacter freundii complex sp. CFNIH2 TaxID=2066049 RepID=UPI0021CC17D1|nr:hypothetical protein [Citrobacter freundii complex sp. CFNIH2]